MNQLPRQSEMFLRWQKSCSVFGPAGETAGHPSVETRSQPCDSGSQFGSAGVLSYRNHLSSEKNLSE